METCDHCSHQLTEHNDIFGCEASVCDCSFLFDGFAVLNPELAAYVRA